MGAKAAGDFTTTVVVCGGGGSRCSCGLLLEMAIFMLVDFLGVILLAGTNGLVVVTKVDKGASLVAIVAVVVGGFPVVHGVVLWTTWWCGM